MRKFTMYCLSLGMGFLLANSAIAQVSGIGYTLSPTAEYVSWNDQAGLEDGLLIGGKVGFSFGEFLELRGVYFQDLDTKTDFSNFGIKDFDPESFVARDVDFKRYGGELKVNLSQGSFLPYVTLGTGIQELGLDSTAMEARKQIYVNAGLGVSLSAADRFTLNLEAKNTQYNFNAANDLLTDEDRTLLAIEEGDFMAERLGNWSVSAALQFYLGGRRPGQLSELDKAYMKRFSSGFRGGSLPVELTLGRMNFSDDLPYRDTWMAGAYAGVDFGPYVGLRGFYMQALEDGDLNFGTDPLKMYGGELRLKLNSGTGLTPFAMLGGGYLNVDEEEYVTRDSLENGAANLQSQPFVLGGVGINLPLSQNFKVFGAARAHLMTNEANVEDVQSTDEISTSWLYSFGFKLDFGKKAKPNALVEDKIDAKLEAQAEENQAKTTALKQKYQQRLADIDTQLNEAYNKGDLDKAAELLQQEDVTKRIVEELEKREMAQVAAKKQQQEKELENIKEQSPVYDVINNSGNRVQMTPAELENLVDEILDGVNDSAKGSGNSDTNAQSMQEMLDRRAMDEKMNNLEKMLLQMNERQSAAGDLSKAEQDLQSESIRRDLTEFSARLMNEISRLETQINNQASTTVVTPDANIVTGSGTTVVDATQQQSVTNGNTLGVQTGGNYLASDTTRIASKLRYEGMSGFTGFNLGGQTTFNVGLRWHYGIGNTKFEFMPEAFFGFGTPSSFGLTGNVVLPIELKNSFVTPYIGAGAGFMQIEDSENDSGVRLNYNVIIGSYLNVWKGRLFVDFTARNAFKYNQIIAGYRFAF